MAVLRMPLINPVHRTSREVFPVSFPLGHLFYGRVKDGLIAELVVELAAVFLGDVGWVDEGFESGKQVVRGEDEDFGGGDWVEPAFYPAPDCGEEGGGSDYLLTFRQNVFSQELEREENKDVEGTYEDSV